MAARQENTNQNSGTLKEGTPKIEPEKVFFSWRAPSRPFKRRDRQFWVRLLSITAVFAFILFLIEGVMPVILAISLLFLFYILSTVEPEPIEYGITDKGVRIADKLIPMSEIGRFWFFERLGSDLLVLETFGLAGRLELVIQRKDVEKIRKTLSAYVPEEQYTPSNLDKVTNWVSKKLPQ